SISHTPSSTPESVMAANANDFSGVADVPRGRLDIALPWAALSAVLLACSMGPIVLALPAPVGGSVLDATLPLGSAGHPLGTDLNGNDVLSRLVNGGRTSLLISLAANLIGLLLGSLIGTT